MAPKIIASHQETAEADKPRRDSEAAGDWGSHVGTAALGCRAGRSPDTWPGHVPRPRIPTISMSPWSKTPPSGIAETRSWEPWNFGRTF